VLHTAMVQAGERAAFLEEVLRSLANFLEGSMNCAPRCSAP